MLLLCQNFHISCEMNKPPLRWKKGESGWWGGVCLFGFCFVLVESSGFCWGFLWVVYFFGFWLDFF